MRPSINLSRLAFAFVIVSASAVAQHGNGFGHSAHGRILWLSRERKGKQQRKRTSVHAYDDATPGG